MNSSTDTLIETANGLGSLASQAVDIGPDKSSLDNLTRNLEELFDCEAATLFAYDTIKKQLYSRNVAWDEVDEIRLDLSTHNLAGFVAATGNPLNIKNVNSKKELAKNNRDLKHDAQWDEKLDFETRSMLVIPLSHDGQFMGVLELINKISDLHFSDEDFLKARAISAVLGIAMSKLEETSPNQSISKKNKLQHTAQAIQTIRTMEEVFVTLQPSFLSLFDAEDSCIYIVDGDKKELYSKFKSGGVVTEDRILLSHQSPAGFAVLENQALNIRNVQDPAELKKIHPDMEPISHKTSTTHNECRSVLVIPIIHKETTVGILQLTNKVKQSVFTAKDEKNGMMIGENLAPVIINRRETVDSKPTLYGMLVKNGLISERELNQILQKAKTSKAGVETLLGQDHFLLNRDIGSSLEAFYNVYYLPYDDSIEPLDPANWKIQQATLESGLWVPLTKKDNTITILANNPDLSALNEVIAKNLSEQTVEISVGLQKDIQKYIKKITAKFKDFVPAPVVPPVTETPRINSTKESPAMPSNAETLTPNPTSESIVTAEKKAGSGLSIVDQFKQTIALAGKKGVTDIHIEPNNETQNLLIRLRKDGACRVFEEMPGHSKADLMAYIKGLAQLDVSKTKIPQNGQSEWSEGSLKLNLNVVIFPTIGDNEDVTIQVTRLSKPVPEYIALDKINFSEPNLVRISSLLNNSEGLILVSGPSNSGKTTTLHSFLGQINSPDKRIMTAEDPVDIVQNGLRQLLIGEESGMNFITALKTLSMASPDAIMVGSLPDQETLKEALLASTKHLVFSSVESGAGIETLLKLQGEMQADPSLLSTNLLLVVAQRLVTALCEDCKEDYHPSQEEFDALTNFYGKQYFPELGVEYNDSLMLKKPVGCKNCLFSGYGEKTTLQEVIVVTPDLKKLIAERASEDKLRAQAIKDEMITLNQDGVYKIFKGDCDLKQIQAAFSIQEKVN